MNEKEIILSYYDEYVEKKKESSDLSRQYSEKAKAFAEDVVGGKKMKKWITAYFKNCLEAEFKESAHEASATNAIAADCRNVFDPNSSVDDDALRNLYQQYRDIRANKAILLAEREDLIAKCAQELDRSGKEVKAFFNYRYTKEKNGESPIDAIDDFIDMIR